MTHLLKINIITIIINQWALFYPEVTDVVTITRSARCWSFRTFTFFSCKVALEGDLIIIIKSKNNELNSTYLLNYLSLYPFRDKVFVFLRKRQDHGPPYFCKSRIKPTHLNHFSISITFNLLSPEWQPHTLPCQQWWLAHIAIFLDLGLQWQSWSNIHHDVPGALTWPYQTQHC